MLNTILSYANITEDAIKQKQNFEKQKEQFQKLQKNSNQKIFFYDSKKPTLQENSDEQCIEIKIIKENSITLLLKNEKEKIFKKYVNGCRTLTELNNLTKELTRLYIDKGYVTSQVYFKAQKINEGILEVIAVEGKVDDITPNELYIENAFLAQEGKYLNLRDLERAIESINRLPSNNATMKIIPSQKVGTSNIQIENQTSNRINGTIGIDNYGSKKTGKFQGSLNFNLESHLQIIKNNP
jgi:hemolysin activation/secretion protein